MVSAKELNIITMDPIFAREGFLVSALGCVIIPDFQFPEIKCKQLHEFESVSKKQLKKVMHRVVLYILPFCILDSRVASWFRGPRFIESVSWSGLRSLMLLHNETTKTKKML